MPKKEKTNRQKSTGLPPTGAACPLDPQVPAAGPGDARPAVGRVAAEAGAAELRRGRAVLGLGAGSIGRGGDERKAKQVGRTEELDHLDLGGGDGKRMDEVRI